MKRSGSLKFIIPRTELKNDEVHTKRTQENELKLERKKTKKIQHIT